MNILRIDWDRSIELTEKDKLKDRLKKINPFVNQVQIQWNKTHNE